MPAVHIRLRASQALGDAIARAEVALPADWTLGFYRVGPQLYSAIAAAPAGQASVQLQGESWLEVADSMAASLDARAAAELEQELQPCPA